MAAYQIGTADPMFQPGEGSGRWASERATAEMRALRYAILGHLPHAAALIGVDAAAHMAHYMGNSGRRYTIRLASLLNDVRSAQRLRDQELEEAKTFVRALPPGTHQIASTRGSGGYAMRNESENWSHAIGGYTVFGKGTAEVREEAGGRLGYRLEFELKFYDRYDWHEGNVVTLFGIEITDDLMGRFHRQGLAREYEMTGSVTSVETWGSPGALRGQAAGPPASR